MTTSDTHFAAGHFRTLEATMIREAKNANRVMLANGNYLLILLGRWAKLTGPTSKVALSK
jgi:hypothetical protein